MPTDSGRFQLNSEVLNIPPEQIYVGINSVNQQWNTLRTKSSIKSKSGFSSIPIMVKCKFTTSLAGWQNHSEDEPINGLLQLRNIVSQIRATPFCYVENQFLRNSILSGSSEPTMALACQQIQITKDNSTTNCVDVMFVFQWFNYFPFLKEWTYKKDFFSPISVDDPRDSLPWKVFYEAEQRRNNYFEIRKLGLTGTLFAFKEFASLKVDKYRELAEDRDTYLALKNQAVDLIAEGTDADFAGNELAISFLTDKKGSKRGTRLFQDMFGGTTSMHPENLTIETVVNTIDQTLDDPDSRFAFLDRNIWIPVFTNKGEPITFRDNPQAARREKDRRAEPEDIMLLSRERNLTLENEGLIITDITISFENILATLPLAGHQYPTFQHIGSIDSKVQMVINSSNQFSRKIQKVYDTIESGALKFKQIPQGLHTLDIDNDFLSLFGIKEFLTEGIESNTLPEQPGRRP